MITHDQARALISARYDELLAPPETRALQEHLASCAGCRQFAADTDSLVNSLRTMPQLPPSPRVSRMVREGIQAGGTSPWGWLGATLRVVTSPGMAVASSLALVAAFAFIIVLAVRPLTGEPQPLATISALADVIETPSTIPAATVSAPTMAPTEAAITAPTQAPTVTPTREPTAVPAPTARPTMTPTADTAAFAPTSTPRSILSRPTESSALETPAPTVAAPAPTSPPIARTEPVATEAAAFTAEAPQPTIAPLVESSNAIGSAMEPEVAPGNEAPSYTEPGADMTAQDDVAAEPGGSELGEPASAPVGENGVIMLTGDDPAAAVEATDNGPATEQAPTAETASAPSTEAAPAAEAASTADTSDVASEPAATEASLALSEPAGPASAPPVLPKRNGNEALTLSGDAMVDDIAATVQADLATDSGPPALPETALAGPVAPVASGGDVPVIGAEITGAPAEAALRQPTAMPEDPATGIQPVSAEGEEVAIAPAADAALSAPVDQDAEVAPVDAAVTGAAAEQPLIAPAPVDLPVATEAPPVVVPIGAPEPAWPGIGGGGTQFQSSAGYSAVVDGAGVTVYGPDNAPIGIIGGGSPIWSPWGTSVLVIGPSGQGAVWDAAAGLLPVEPAATAARDIPAGWLGSDPVVQRVYLDGSGVVELRVVPVTGAPGYALGTATTDSVFGEGVTAARLSPDGGQISFVSGGQLYIAPVSGPGSAAPAG